MVEQLQTFASPTIDEAFALAVQNHEAGELVLAQQMCRKVLLAKPQHAAACHLLGVLAFQAGSFEEAVVHIRKALALDPSVPVYHFNLGLSYAARRQMIAAAACFQQAIAIHPSFAEAHNALGNTLQKLGKRDQAAAHCRVALSLQPNYADAHGNLGLALAEQGNLGDAESHYLEALRLDPKMVKVQNNLGNVLALRGRYAEAIDHYRAALAQRPDYAEAHCNLANALNLQDQPDEAVYHGEQALRVRPDFAQAHHNLAGALKMQGRFEEALRHFDEALRLVPSYAETHLSRAILRLLCGDLQRGWPEYEARWVQPGVVRRPFAQPLWDGSDLRGRTILLHAEQGLGDTLQFIRYAPMLKERGAQVIVECQAALMGLAAGVAGIHCLVARGSMLPAFDVHAPMLSLPGILKTTVETIPAQVPYLQADPKLVEHWRGLLEPLWNFKVGIVWQGRPQYAFDRQRSIPLSWFSHLAAVPGVELISLQKGPGTEQLQKLANQVPVFDLGPKLDEAAGPFMDTAAVMKNLDLVISSDTATAHLAGALGVPVWVPLPFVPDWRWLLQREDSPWYPSMRLFRQTQCGRWDDVFERMAKELMAVVERVDKLAEESTPLTAGLDSAADC